LPGGLFRKKRVPREPPVFLQNPDSARAGFGEQSSRPGSSQPSEELGSSGKEIRKCGQRPSPERAGNRSAFSGSVHCRDCRAVGRYESKPSVSSCLQTIFSCRDLVRRRTTAPDLDKRRGVPEKRSRCHSYRAPPFSFPGGLGRQSDKRKLTPTTKITIFGAPLDNHSGFRMPIR
jgi:hypothetical protein